MKQKFVPKDKLSKKARREQNAQRRETWDFSPVSRVIPNKKKMNKRDPHSERAKAEWGVFLQSFR